MNITMEGKYAYRKEPTKQVRILCVDVPYESQPVLSMDTDGHVFRHTKEGKWTLGKETSRDLVPLEELPIERWGVADGSGAFRTSFSREELAQQYASHVNGRYFLMREVKE